tara:strand:- start:60 stop:710 length:651 start_codon:yes stop_codon:yes gene_type:complete
MNKKSVLETLKKLRENKKRNFSQSVDFIVILKDIDLKKTDQQVEYFLQLHYSRGKKIKVCALVDTELLEEAKSACDKVIHVDDFPNFAKDKKATKKLAEDYDVFIAQGNIMAKVATTFGRTFGPRGKMPNPKAGCVVPPKASLKPVIQKIQNMLKVSIKTTPMFMCSIGKEDQKEEELVDNIITLYNSLIQNLPKEKNNIKKTFLKLTMTKAIEVN